MCFAPQRRALFRHLNFQKWSENGVFLTFSLPNVLRATTACTFSTSQLLKVVRNPCVFNFFTSKCASPQQRALFRHLNFQKWSENGVFLASSLTNVLRATTACTLSTSQLPKVVREWCVFCTFWLRNVLRATTACTFSSLWPDGSAPAALASLLFDPPEPQNIGKTQCFATFLPFCAPELLSSDSLPSLVFSLLLFSSLWLFPSLLFICPYCRKFDF